MEKTESEVRNELLEVIDSVQKTASDFLQSVLDKFQTSLSKITELPSDTLRDIVNECDSREIAW